MKLPVEWLREYVQTPLSDDALADKLTMAGLEVEETTDSGDGPVFHTKVTPNRGDWLSVSGNVGHQWVNHALPDYTHYDIGATASWHNFALDARFNGTDMNTAQCGAYMGDPHSTCTGGFVAMLTYTIPDLLHPFQ